MTKKLKASYALRPETLIQMLHHAYAMGFITAVCDVEDTDDEPIPMDQGGPRSELWVKQQADAMLGMRRRKDGTYYMPASRNTPNAEVTGLGRTTGATMTRADFIRQAAEARQTMQELARLFPGCFHADGRPSAYPEGNAGPPRAAQRKSNRPWPQQEQRMTTKPAGASPVERHVRPLRPLVIYHGNCADGFSAAWCFWRKYGTGADYLAGVYQQDPPDVTGRDVYLVDFSYKRAVVEQMLKTARSVCLIDHHKTAIEDLAGLEGLRQYTDLDRSGATLAWDFLFPGEDRPLLLGHVEDRDLCRFKLAGTREIQALVFSHEYSFETWDKLMSADRVELLKMTAAGAAIERKHHKDVAELVAVCKRRMVIGAYDVPVASLPYTLVSDAAHLMAQGEPFAACYWDTADGRVFGLRATDEGVDVSDVAKQYGGGGHAKAAGFKVPRWHVLAMA